jgi:hypothetical protein
MDVVLRLQLTEEGADAEQLDELTGFLRQELLQLDVEDVTKLPAGEPPPGPGGWMPAPWAAYWWVSAVLPRA